ncbi:MAG: response regulator transcription factor [Pseudomonadota bacterium]
MSEPDIILCDDENDLREVIAEYLRTRGFNVREAASAAELSRLCEARTPDVIVLDVRMPGEDGLSALRRLRASSDVPVIMLTAADELIDRVVGLELGADDYLGKPVDPREIEARVRTLLRRVGAHAGSVARKTGATRLKVGHCELDLEAAMLFDADGNEIPMTAMEFSLLQCFLENTGRVLNRDQLLEQAHNRGWEPFDRSIDLRISRLRKKIEPNPSKPQLIKTVRGIGYVFDPKGIVA